MIIELLLNALYNIFKILTTPIKIPPMPEQASQYIEQFFDYIEMGAGILANYTPLGYLLTLFGVVIAVDIGIKLYHFVMWIIRKIPMAGIS